MVTIYLNRGKIASRNPKTSPEQYEIMVQYIENHPNLKSNRLTNHFTAKDRCRLWEDLTECLNSVKGPQKDVQKWQKTWTDLKHITLKAARIKRKQLEMNGSFNMEAFQDELSPLQLRVLNLVGWNEAFGNLSIEEGNFDKESPPSPSDAFFPIVEEHSYSETDEQTHENQEMDDVVDDTESNIELFSITKYSDNEDYQTGRTEDNITTNLLLQHQSKILEKISKQHKQILNVEQAKREKNTTNSINVLLEQQNKLLEKIANHLELLANAEQVKKEQQNNAISVLLEQQNRLLAKIAEQQERIADAEHRKADTLPELSSTIKELLNK